MSIIAEIGLIVAYAKNNVIGKDGHIPWDIPGEQERFKQLTMGNTVIMGRRTYEEIGHPLPDRRTVVVSGTKNFDARNCLTAVSLQEAIRLAGEDQWGRMERTGYAVDPVNAGMCRRNIYIAGGERLYREALPLVDVMYITELDLEIEGDRFFPKFDEALFEKKIDHITGGEIPYTYLTYIRKNPLNGHRDHSGRVENG